MISLNLNKLMHFFSIKFFLQLNQIKVKHVNTGGFMHNFILLYRLDRIGEESGDGERVSTLRLS